MRSTVREMFSPQAGLTYLDSATYGLPPAPTTAALRAAVSAWEKGTAQWIEDWDRPGESARSLFGDLVGAAPGQVVLLPASSVGVGLVAASLAPGEEVVVAADEFTSVLFPLLVARERGVVVREVPFADIGGEIRPSTALVAVSLVQMQTGNVAPIEEIASRAAQVGARLLVDGTQGVPFVPLPIDQIDYLVCSAYKHLLCPRGVAFMVVRRGGDDGMAPWNANWRSADDPYGRYFGGPLTLAQGAARYDVSLAWIPWIGAVESLRLLLEWQRRGVLDHPPRLAADLAAELGVPWGGATLVCVPVESPERVGAALAAGGIKAAVRGDSVRFATHVYNDHEDVGRAAAVLRNGPDVSG